MHFEHRDEYFLFVLSLSQLHSFSLQRDPSESVPELDVLPVESESSRDQSILSGLMCAEQSRHLHTIELSLVQSALIIVTEQ